MANFFQYSNWLPQGNSLLPKYHHYVLFDLRPRNMAYPILSCILQFKVYIVILCAFCQIFSGITVYGSIESFAFPHATPITNTRCGRTYDCNSGGIFYKPFSPISDNERCVWQISVPNAKGYVVQILNFGYSPEETPVEEQGIVVVAHARHRPPVQYFPNTTDSLTIPDCNLLIVTFYTGEIQSLTSNTGFAMDFYTIFTHGDAPEVARESMHYRLGSDEFYLKYPLHGNYRSHELTSFVFLPRDNYFDEGVTNIIVYMRNGVSTNNGCGDRLKLYFVQVNGTTGANGWVFQGGICGNIETELITSKEPILIIFETDSYYESTGFHFSYAA